MEDLNGQYRTGGQGSYALSSSLYLFIYGVALFQKLCDCIPREVEAC